MPNFANRRVKPQGKQHHRGVGTFVSIIALLIIVVPILLIARYRRELDRPITISENSRLFIIPEGASTVTIAEGLYKNGVFNSKTQVLAFKIYVRSNHLGNQFQAGSYDLPEVADMKALVEYLQHAKQNSVWVTFQEGLRADEFAQICAETPGVNCDKEKFNALITDNSLIRELLADSSMDAEHIDSLEGFLFPDKYLIPINATEEDIVRTMVNNFFTKTGTLQSDTDLSYDDLIIASIVEREGRRSDDRAIIAGIIKKRLAENWPLEVDVTHLYYFKDWKKELTWADLQEDQPYNMRIHTGLPPTPICNPGLDAISATVNPEPSDYFFWLADPDGAVHFATTIEEHNANISKYLY